MPLVRLAQSFYCYVHTVVMVVKFTNGDLIVFESGPEMSRNDWSYHFTLQAGYLEIEIIDWLVKIFEVGYSLYFQKTNLKTWNNFRIEFSHLVDYYKCDQFKPGVSGVKASNHGNSIWSNLCWKSVQPLLTSTCKEVNNSKEKRNSMLTSLQQKFRVYGVDLRRNHKGMLKLWHWNCMNYSVQYF